MITFSAFLICYCNFGFLVISRTCILGQSYYTESIWILSHRTKKKGTLHAQSHFGSSSLTDNIKWHIIETNNTEYELSIKKKKRNQNRAQTHVQSSFEHLSTSCSRALLQNAHRTQKYINNEQQLQSNNDNTKIRKKITTTTTTDYRKHF